MNKLKLPWSDLSSTHDYALSVADVELKEGLPAVASVLFLGGDVEPIPLEWFRRPYEETP